jgi:hypothetical protein
MSIVCLDTVTKKNILEIVKNDNEFLDINNYFILSPYYNKKQFNVNERKTTEFNTRLINIKSINDKTLILDELLGGKKLKKDGKYVLSFNSEKLCEYVNNYINPSIEWIEEQKQYKISNSGQCLISTEDIIKYYTDERGGFFTYKLINPYLREPGSFKEKYERQMFSIANSILTKSILSMNSFISQAPVTKEDLILFRVLRKEFAKETYEKITQLGSEFEFNDKGFSSFSLLPLVHFTETSLQDMDLHIKRCCLISFVLPKGENCLLTSIYSDFPTEKEILLPLNSFKLKPVNVFPIELYEKKYNEKTRAYKTKVREYLHYKCEYIKKP